MNIYSQKFYILFYILHLTMGVQWVMQLEMREYIHESYVQQNLQWYFSNYSRFQLMGSPVTWGSHLIGPDLEEQNPIEEYLRVSSA